MSSPQDPPTTTSGPTPDEPTPDERPDEPTAATSTDPGSVQVLGGRYEIHRKLARGGMAEVYLARDRSLDRPVAVKVLFPEYATDPSFVERFRREAQAAANLTHPNIVGVYDWGAEGGTYFIVMEFVDGQSLADVVRSAGPLHPTRAAEIAFEVAGALGFAHSRGVVHRDVKPGNVLIGSSGQAKVADFGIARALSSPSEELTAAGSVMGTATYFSPEQAQGFAVDARSDLYSLGVVLYETVCGRPPFTGDTPVAIAYKHVQEAPPRPTSIVAGVPEGLEAIIGKLLAKNPDNRYLSADDLRADLRRFLDGETPIALDEYRRPIAGAAVAAAVVGDSDATQVVGAVAPPPPGDDEWEDEGEEEPEKSRTGWFIAALVLLLLIAAGLAFWVIKSLNDEGGRADQVEVPSLIGLTEGEARQRVTDEGFEPDVRQEPNDTVPSGQVFDQSPKESTLADKGSTVLIKVSSGKEMVTVPAGLEGSTQAEATKAITDAGLVPNAAQAPSKTIAAGQVIGTNPTGGTAVEKGSEVTIFVSTGDNAVAIPNVANRTVSQASTALTNAGFKVGDKIEQPSDEVAKGNVIGTQPTGTAAKGATIDLLVSTGPQPVRVPGVTGQTQANATDAIQNAGLEVDTKFENLPAGDPDNGLVTDQDPAASTQVAPGSTVTITVGRAAASTTTTAP